MSVEINLTERQLQLAVFKVAIALTGGIFVVALVLSLLFSAKVLSGIVIPALLISVSVNLLTNAFLVILRVVDWFDARRAKKAIG